MTEPSSRSCQGDSSSESVASSDVRAALAEVDVPADIDVDGGYVDLEQRLRLNGFVRPVLRASVVHNSGEQQLASAVLALAQEQAQLAQCLKTPSQDAVVGASSHTRPPPAGAAVAFQSASGAFRLHMAD